MRQIKFRAYDKKKKEWLLGYELPNLGGFSMFGEVMMMGEYANLLSSYFPDRLDDIELMQFTGSKDANEVELYEGDLIKGNFQNDMGSFYPATARIEWCEVHGGFEAVKGHGDQRRGCTIGENVVRVGNIYENPEIET